MKTCTMCKSSKPLTDFYKDSRRKDGRGIYCKSCWKIKYQTEPEHLAARSAAVKRRYAKISETPEYKEKRRYQQLQYLYKMSREQCIEMLNAQNNRCLICETEFNDAIFPVLDHDHKCCPGNKSCGKCWRGFLCTLCNKGIGCLQDSPTIIEKALNYVRTNSCTKVKD